MLQRESLKLKSSKQDPSEGSTSSRIDANIWDLWSSEEQLALLVVRPNLLSLDGNAGQI